MSGVHNSQLLSFFPGCTAILAGWVYPRNSGSFDGCHCFKQLAARFNWCGKTPKPEYNFKIILSLFRTMQTRAGGAKRGGGGGQTDSSSSSDDDDITV